jgi:hypothetical protein
MTRKTQFAGVPPPGWPRVVKCWYGLAATGGVCFGLSGEQRPFGTELLGHPSVVFGITVGAALLALRLVLARPVPEVIPDRALLVGFGLGLAMFLAGNFVAIHVPAVLP